MQTLQRRLGVPGAAAIGIASMLGAGIFFVWAPATAEAGGAVLVALPLAAGVAILNALSTTRLAMRHPVAGGAYAYGRAELGATTGFVAGVLFLLGKTASVAAIGLIAGSYLWPGAERVVAVGLVVVLAAINAVGVRATAAVSAVAAGLVIAVLLVVLVVAVVGPGDRAAGPAAGPATGPPAITWPDASAGAAFGVLTAAGLIFFAFAGYARIATLAEEVRDPVRTLPRAVVTSITVVLVLSAATLGVLLVVLGTAGLAGSTSPVADAAGEAWAPVVRAAVAIACIGSMTGVLAGLSRTAMAMSRDRELPGPLARIATRTGTPVVAELVVAMVAIAAVLVLDPARVVGLSACAVLFYYGIAHLAALRAGRVLGLPRAVPIAGLVACVGIALATPWPALVTVLAVAAAAVGARALVRRSRRP